MVAGASELIFSDCDFSMERGGCRIAPKCSPKCSGFILCICVFLSQVRDGNIAERRRPGSLTGAAWPGFGESPQRTLGERVGELWEELEKNSGRNVAKSAAGQARARHRQKSRSHLIRPGAERNLHGA
jgi:hypothetical protein